MRHSMVVVLFCFATQMIAFGVVEEYVRCLYQKAKARPIYLIKHIED